RMYNQWQSCLPSRFLDELPAEAVEAAVTGRPGRMSRQQLQHSIDDLLQQYQPPETPRPKAPTNQSAEFPAGCKVLHPTFGQGTVLSSEGDKLQIVFTKVGVKKIMKEFITRA